MKMRIEAGVNENSENFILHDLDNDCKVKEPVFWADDTKGEYCYAVFDFTVDLMTVERATSRFY